MTFPRLLTEAQKILESSGNECPENDSKELLFYVFGFDLKGYADTVSEGRTADEALTEEFLKYIKKRAEGYPLQYITRKAPFMGRWFVVDESVLIPRLDTEILADTAVKLIENDLSDICESYPRRGENAAGGYSVIDIGTGSGCIVISVLLELCKYIEKNGMDIPLDFTGCDLSGPALAIAERNARELNAPVKFVKSDLLEDVPGMFDAVISNPPYIRSGDIAALDGEVRLFEPACALDGGADGVGFYRRIGRDAKDRIKRGGFLALEIGYDEADDVSEILEEYGYKKINVIKDLAGHDRVITCRRP